MHAGAATARAAAPRVRRDVVRARHTTRENSPCPAALPRAAALAAQARAILVTLLASVSAQALLLLPVPAEATATAVMGALVNASEHTYDLPGHVSGPWTPWTSVALGAAFTDAAIAAGTARDQAPTLHNLTLSYRTAPADAATTNPPRALLDLAITVHGLEPDGWVALGFGGSMVGADAHVARVGVTNGTMEAAVRDMHIADRSGPIPDTDGGLGTNDIMPGSVRALVEGDTTTIAWTRPLEASDNDASPVRDADIDVSPGVQTPVVFALGSGSGSTFSYHGRRRRGWGTVEFGSTSSCGPDTCAAAIATAEAAALASCHPTVSDGASREFLSVQLSTPPLGGYGLSWRVRPANASELVAVGAVASASAGLQGQGGEEDAPSVIDFRIEAAEYVPGEYVGLGVGNGMTGADIALAFIDPETGAGEVVDAWSSSYDPELDSQLSSQGVDGTSDFVPGSVATSVEGDVATFSWTRFAKPPSGDPHDTEIDVTGNELTSLMFARGVNLGFPSNGGGLGIDNAHHGPTRRGIALVGFGASGGAAAVLPSPPGRSGTMFLHGGIMFFVWGLNVPAAVFVARYLKTWNQWAVWHVRMQVVSTIGVVLTVAAVLVDDSDAFGKPHSVVGALLMTCVFLQQVLGRRALTGLRASVHQRWHKVTRLSHAVLGWAMLAGAVFQGYLGSELLLRGETRPHIRGAVLHLQTAWVVLMLVLFGVGEARKHMPGQFARMQFIVSSSCGRGGGGKTHVLAMSATSPNAAKHRTRVQPGGAARAQPVVHAGKLLSEKLGFDAWGHLSELRVIPWSELNERLDKGGKLLVVDGVVLDVKGFLQAHPGGARVMLEHLGTDATSALLGSFHLASSRGSSLESRELSPRVAAAAASPGVGSARPSEPSPFRILRMAPGDAASDRNLVLRPTDSGRGGSDGTGSGHVETASTFVPKSSRIVESTDRTYRVPMHSHSGAAWVKMLDLAVAVIAADPEVDDIVDSRGRRGGRRHRRGSVAERLGGTAIAQAQGLTGDLVLMADAARGLQLPGSLSETARNQLRVYHISQFHALVPEDVSSAEILLRPTFYMLRLTCNPGSTPLHRPLPGEHYSLHLTRDVYGHVEVLSRRYTPVIVGAVQRPQRAGAPAGAALMPPEDAEDRVVAAVAGGFRGEVAGGAAAAAAQPQPADAEVDDGTSVVLYVKVYPDGEMSQALRTLEIGATVRMHGPHGRPLLNPRRADGCWSHCTMLCAGSGITPALQLLHYHFLHAGAPLQAPWATTSGAGGDGSGGDAGAGDPAKPLPRSMCHLVTFNRREADVPVLGQLTEASGFFHESQGLAVALDVIHTLTSPTLDAFPPEATGRVSADLLRHVLPPAPKRAVRSSSRRRSRAKGDAASSSSSSGGSFSESESGAEASKPAAAQRARRNSAKRSRRTSKEGPQAVGHEKHTSSGAMGSVPGVVGSPPAPEPGLGSGDTGADDSDSEVDSTSMMSSKSTRRLLMASSRDLHKLLEQAKNGGGPRSVGIVVGSSAVRVESDAIAGGEGGGAAGIGGAVSPTAVALRSSTSDAVSASAATTVDLRRDKSLLSRKYTGWDAPWLRSAQVQSIIAEAEALVDDAKSDAGRETTPVQDRLTATDAADTPQARSGAGASAGSGSRTTTPVATTSARNRWHAAAEAVMATVAVGTDGAKFHKAVRAALLLQHQRRAAMAAAAAPAPAGAGGEVSGITTASEVHAEEQSTTDNTLVVVCGSSAFGRAAVDALREVGYPRSCIVVLGDQ